MTGVTEVVFAAGAGTRLRPLTGSLPKAMVPVLDVPLIDLALNRPGDVPWAARFVNASHLSAPLREHLSSRPEIELLDEGDEPVGTAATLRLLLPRLTETVLTLNCDLVSDLSTQALLTTHRSGGRPCTLAVRAVGSGADIRIESGRTRLIDRRSEDCAGFVFLGAACIDRALLRAIPLHTPLGLAEGLLRSAVDGQQVALHEHRGYSEDAGTPARLLQISLDALSGGFPIDPPGTLSPGGYVGPGASVEDRALGPGAIVLAGAQVGPGTRITGGIVWPGSQVPGDLDLRRGIWYGGEFLPLA